MSDYTKVREVLQYSEIVYYKDGEEIGRERVYDDSLYDSEPEEAMTQQEIDDYGSEEDWSNE
jgi:hypothetical protein